MPDVAVDIIWAHFDLAAHELMAHLLGLGHRRIAMVWGVGRSELGNDRLTAYREDLAKAGIAYNPDYVASCGNTLEDSVCAAQKLFSLDPLPTAIIGINDVMAFGAMQVAMRADGAGALEKPLAFSTNHSFTRTPGGAWVNQRLPGGRPQANRHR